MRKKAKADRNIRLEGGAVDDVVAIVSGKGEEGGVGVRRGTDEAAGEQ